MQLDKFTAAYIEAALWSSMDDDGTPLDQGDQCLLSREAEGRMAADCAAFQRMAGELIVGEEERAGHDFWLTRNHHGAGFWDGDWPEHGDTLTEMAQTFLDCDLYVGDDGLIYASAAANPRCTVCGKPLDWDRPSGVCSEVCLRQGQAAGDWYAANVEGNRVEVVVDPTLDRPDLPVPTYKPDWRDLED